MRRLVLAAGLLAALAAPAAATADPLTVGRDKLHERVAAECRRVALRTDEHCSTGTGARVDRAGIAAHKASPLARVLRFQRERGDGLPFADAPWLGTHNSFNSTAELPTVSHTDSNQQLTVVEQLDLDVRSLELDVHWPLRPSTHGRLSPIVCHGYGPAGCSTERTLDEHLTDIKAWLESHGNEDEVLLLYLEDQLDDPSELRGDEHPDLRLRYDVSAQVVEDVLGSLLFKPRGEGCTNLPLDLTRDAVRRAGARVVVVGDCGEGGWQEVSHAWPPAVRFEARPLDWSCGMLPAEPRLVRYFEDSTFLAQTPASSPDDGLTEDTVRAMVSCGVDLLGLDQLVPGDARLEATAWSWADDVPDAGTPAVQRPDGRWIAVKPTGARPAACRAGTRWVLTVPVPLGDAAAACVSLGAIWDAPRTGRENADLVADGTRAGAWLGWTEAATAGVAAPAAAGRAARAARAG